MLQSIVGVLALLGAASSTSDFGGNGSPINPSPYYYSEINSMEYDAESDHQSFNDYDDMSDSFATVDSSLLYDEGCSVSSQAMMINGGGDDSLLNSLDILLDTDEDFSDDEDDDEDDGHSSMLSNDSLRRTKVPAGGEASAPRYQSNSRSVATSQATYYESEIRLNQNQARTRSAFGVRKASAAFAVNHAVSTTLGRRCLC